jgi:hypothetical protein
MFSSLAFPVLSPMAAASSSHFSALENSAASSPDRRFDTCSVSLQQPERTYLGRGIMKTTFAPPQRPAGICHRVNYYRVNFRQVQLFKCLTQFFDFARFGGPAATGQINNHVSVFSGGFGDFAHVGGPNEYRPAGVVLS